MAEMKDEAIDTSDISELDDDFFHNAKIKMPPEQSMTVGCIMTIYFITVGIVVTHRRIGRHIEKLRNL